MSGAGSLSSEASFETTKRGRPIAFPATPFLPPSLEFSGKSLLLAALFLLVVTPDPARCDELRSTHLSVDDGLSQSTVWCIHQDASGFFWFGTGDGLNRYDGYGFKVFRHDDRDSTSLIDNAVQCLAEDRRGRIWVGTDAGLCYYDKETDRFVRLADSVGRDRHIARCQILRLLVDRAGILWVGTAHGLAFLDTGPSSPARVLRDLPAGLTHTSTQVIYESPGRAVWIASGDSLYAWEPTLNRARAVPIPENHAVISSLWQDDAGVLWLGTFASELISLDVQRSVCVRFPYPSEESQRAAGNQLSAIAGDRSGVLWVGARLGGLRRFDRGTHRWHRFDPGIARQRFEGVTALCVDRSGLLWVGYDGAGILKIRTTPMKFRHILLPALPGGVSGDNFLKPIAVDRGGRLWLGTFDKGLAVVTLRTGAVKRYRHAASSPSTLKSNSVIALLEDRRGRVWVGTAGGLDLYDPDTDGFLHFPSDGADGAGRPMPAESRGPSGSEVRCFCEDAAGTIWVGTAGGLFTIDPSSRRLREAVLTGAQAPVLAGVWIESIAGAPDGTLWIGTALHGLVHYGAGDTLLGVYPHDVSGTLSHNMVKSIHMRGDGVVWVGTMDGLNRFDPVTGSWKQYHESDGLPDGTIYGILPAGSSTLWMSTNRGLSRMEMADPDHPAFRNYTPDDGLQSYEFNTNSYFATRDGEMFFGGINGLNSFFPDSIKDNPNIPPVVLTGFKKFDQPASLGMAMELVRSIDLEYTESVFSFEFAALEYTNPARNRYAYMMEGLDREWIDCGNRREARYTNLRPGTYAFKVRGANDDGVWNESGLVVRVTIVPPFWQRFWFLALVGIALSVSFGASVRAIAVRRFKREIEALERQREADRERQATRDRIARDLHDDVASTLSSISLFVESSRSRLRQAGGGAGAVLDRLHALARDAEDAMEQAVWSLSSGHDTLGELVARIRDVAYETCADNGIRSDIALGEIPGDLSLREQTRKNIYLVFRESLGNAVKHGHAGLIEVNVGVEADRFFLTVRDDGKGFVPGEITRRSRGGNGLGNLRVRAGEIGAEVTVTSHPGKGTTVVLSMGITHMRH